MEVLAAASASSGLDVYKVGILLAGPMVCLEQTQCYSVDFP